jgi:ADP-dependent NAD(P)H-hydrate dehydratase / NAD(P)H-hydrate epimerase
MEPLYTAAEMKAAEAGHDVDTLMERAARAVADAVLTRYPEARVVRAVCGKGANGGDGRIAARMLRDAGLDAEESTELQGADVVLDALFGTGFSGAPRTDAAELILRMNAATAPVVAVDIPSGVDASTGEVPGEAVEAELTVTMHGLKVGLDVGPGCFRAGDVVVADIGLEPRATAHALAGEALLARVPRKRPGDNKYTAGSVLVVGGSRGMSGAAALSARAAFRADAGYVAIAAPDESLPVLETLVLEAVKRPLGEVDEAAKRARALALGPGLGRGDAERALVRRLLIETELPAVVDADGLDGLEPFERHAETVLTPHSGELGRLLGEEATWVDAHRLEALGRAVERFGCVVLLKGPDTLIGAPGEGVWVVGDNLPGLATAGTGDVLTGIVAAFLAKGLDARTAAAAGAVVHRRAARLSGKQAGLVASDVVEALPAALAGPPDER